MHTPPKDVIASSFLKSYVRVLPLFIFLVQIPLCTSNSTLAIFVSLGICFRVLQIGDILHSMYIVHSRTHANREGVCVLLTGFVNCG